jgi:hypothetical protein
MCFIIIFFILNIFFIVNEIKIVFFIIFQTIIGRFRKTHTCKISYRQRSLKLSTHKIQSLVQYRYTERPSLLESMSPRS